MKDITPNGWWRPAVGGWFNVATLNKAHWIRHPWAFLFSMKLDFDDDAMGAPAVHLSCVIWDNDKGKLLYDLNILYPVRKGQINFDIDSEEYIICLDAEKREYGDNDEEDYCRMFVHFDLMTAIQMRDHLNSFISMIEMKRKGIL